MAVSAASRAPWAKTGRCIVCGTMAENTLLPLPPTPLSPDHGSGAAGTHVHGGTARAAGAVEVSPVFRAIVCDKCGSKSVTMPSRGAAAVPQRGLGGVEGGNGGALKPVATVYIRQEQLVNLVHLLSGILSSPSLQAWREGLWDLYEVSPGACWSKNALVERGVRGLDAEDAVPGSALHGCKMSVTRVVTFFWEESGFGRLRQCGDHSRVALLRDCSIQSHPIYL